MPAGLEIKEGRHGRGVFATRHFDKGDSVESCPTLELPADQVVGRLNDYVFGSNEGEDEVLLLLGFGMLYNHSAEPNLEYVQEEPRRDHVRRHPAGRARRRADDRLRRGVVGHAQPGARLMTYLAAEARQRLLDEIADAIDELGRALSALGAAYELLDERSADRLEDELFGPVQKAYGRAKRTHADFAVRHGCRGARSRSRRRAPPRATRGSSSSARSRPSRRPRRLFVELQDSMMPVQVGDPELRAGLADVRGLIDTALAAAPQFLRTLGR